MLQKELLKTKPGPGHLLPSSTYYSEMQTFICPILPFRALSECTVHPRSLKSKLSHRAGFRHNHTCTAQWVQFWRLAERGNKQK